MPKEIEKCCVEECANYGEPWYGFDFFLCDSCVEELLRWLDSEFAKNYLSHPNN